MDLMISHLPYVVTGTEVLTDQNIAIEGGRIAAITPAGKGADDVDGADRAVGASGAADHPADSAARTIDGRTLCAIPSFKNAHTHAAMTLLRGFGDDMRLQDWLQGKIWPAEATLDGTDIYWGTRLAALEMIRSGTTFANDMYFFFPEAVRAFTDAGIRGAVGLALFDFFDADRRREQQATVDELLDRFAGGGLGGVGGAGGARVFPTIAPHSIYTCSPDLLRWAAGRSRELDLVYHIHMSETQQEVDDCVAAHGVRPWQWLEQIGVLAEIAGRGIAAHGVWLDESELQLIADYKITLAHNPASNMKLSSGAFDWTRVRERNIPVMLAPDGVASNNNLDMFDEMKLAALMQKHTFGDPLRLSAHEVVRLATGGYSDVFSRWGVGGGLTVGAPADIALVNLEEPQMTPVHNIESNLAYAANGSMVDTVICAGEVVMEHRAVADAPEVLREARRRAGALAARAAAGK